MEYALISDEPYVIGNDVPINLVSLDGLNPNDKVTHIGNYEKNITSSNRVDNFTPFATYAGTKFIEAGDYSGLAALFLLPDKDGDNSIYKIYYITTTELIVPRHSDQGIRIFKRMYKKYEQ